MFNFKVIQLIQDSFRFLHKSKAHVVFLWLFMTYKTLIPTISEIVLGVQNQYFDPQLPMKGIPFELFAKCRETYFIKKFRGLGIPLISCQNREILA